MAFGIANLRLCTAVVGPPDWHHEPPTLPLMRRVFCANDLNYFAQNEQHLRIFITICANVIRLFLM